MAERLTMDEVPVEQRPKNTAPQIEPGFLGKLKREWSDTGCQVPDIVDDTRADVKKTAEPKSDSEL